MDSIDFLEHGGGRIQVRLGGADLDLEDPREMHYQRVLLALYAEYVPGTPDCVDWKRALIFDHWRAAWDLPVFDQARRLAYVVDHYRGAVTSDLVRYAGRDLGELWRARRWSLLLDLIDRLPSYSHYMAAVATDEEHAKMMAETLARQRAEGEEETPEGPALTIWTPEVAVLTTLVDAVNSVQHTLVAVNADSKGKVPDPPKPMPRPVTAIDAAVKRAKHADRKARHEALVARVLPGRAPVKPPSQDPVH